MIQWKTILELSESHLIRTIRIAMVGGGEFSSRLNFFRLISPLTDIPPPLPP